MCLAVKEVKYQWCQLNMFQKPQWFKDINGGFIPMMEFPNGDIYWESNLLCELIEDAYPNQGYSLLPKDPFERTKLKLTMA